MANEITLIPYSLIQHCDIVIELTGHNRSCSFYNDVHKHAPLLLTMDDNTGEYYTNDGTQINQDLTYSLSLQKACEAFAGHWLPLPYLKQHRIANTALGLAPLNWARLYIDYNAPDGKADNKLLRKAVIAFDTELQIPPEPSESDTPNYSYTKYAPEPGDINNTVYFALPNNLNDIENYAQIKWVSGWIKDVFSHSEAARKLRRDEETDEALCQYALAHYMTLVRALQVHAICPAVRFINTLDANERSQPIKVDFVLDVGNSRSCGIIVEHPDNTVQNQNINLDHSYPIKLRSLSSPTEVFTKPFPSRIEFARPYFGLDFFSRQSGRDAAFIWPSAARVGWEAETLAGYAIGNMGSTGMSSPKRYLWSIEPTSQEWYFNHALHPVDALRPEEPVTNSGFFTAFNDCGECYRDGQIGLPAVTANFCRSSLMSFFLRELILQVLTLINNPQNRAQRDKSAAQRILNKIVLTMPTAMSKPERDFLARRLDDAITSLWAELGEHAQEKPSTLLQWDEASATQAVFLYNEVVCNFLGNSRNFFAASARSGQLTAIQNNGHSQLRIASIDIGGGTSDMIVTTYNLDGTALVPVQEFREGFNIAGDDILYDVIADHVLPALSNHLTDSGVSDADLLLKRLFGANFGDQPQQERTLRQQACTQILMPFGYALLRAHEACGLFPSNETDKISWEQLFIEHSSPNERVLDYLYTTAREAGAKEDFKLSELVVSVNHIALFKTIQNTMNRVLACFAEVLFEYDCDYLLMAGRPSRLPAIQALITAKWAISPDRLIFMDRYKVGEWHPYRQIDGSIGDPKTCAAVGAMLCAYATGGLSNFYLQSNELKMRSTARFIGRMTGVTIQNQDILFSNIDLDQRNANFGTAQTSFSEPICIGFRQMDLERWPATMLYRMEYKDSEKYGAAAPFKVSIEKIPPEDDKKYQIFEISDIEVQNEERARGLGINKNSIRLRLQTLRDDQGFWQDTGIFNV